MEEGMAEEKREVGETGAAAGTRPSDVEGAEAEQGQPSALGGDTATRSGTRPTPKDERSGQ